MASTPNIGNPTDPGDGRKRHLPSKRLGPTINFDWVVNSFMEPPGKLTELETPPCASPPPMKSLDAARLTSKSEIPFQRDERDSRIGSLWRLQARALGWCYLSTAIQSRTIMLSPITTMRIQLVATPKASGLPCKRPRARRLPRRPDRRIIDVRSLKEAV